MPDLDPNITLFLKNRYLWNYKLYLSKIHKVKNTLLEVSCLSQSSDVYVYRLNPTRSKKIPLTEKIGLREIRGVSQNSLFGSTPIFSIYTKVCLSFLQMIFCIKVVVDVVDVKTRRF